jgi:hypothetical protein
MIEDRKSHLRSELEAIHRDIARVSGAISLALTQTSIRTDRVVNMGERLRRAQKRLDELAEALIKMQAEING